MQPNILVHIKEEYFQRYVHLIQKFNNNLNAYLNFYINDFNSIIFFQRPIIENLFSKHSIKMSNHSRNFGEYSVNHFYKEDASETINSTRFKIGVFRYNKNVF